MATLKYEANSNFQIGTLGSGYTSGGLSLSLTAGHGARFPSTGDFWVRVDDEIFKVTARSTDTLTVTGAQDGTSASNHSSGVNVTWVLAVGAFDQVRTDLASIYDTYANVSVMTFTTKDVGKVAYIQDSPYIARWNGTSWTYYLPEIGAVAVPPASLSFSWQNQSSSTIDTTNGYAYLDGVNNGSSGHKWKLRTMAIPTPSSPYTLICYFRAIAPSQSSANNRMGIVIFESGSGKFIDLDKNSYGALTELVDSLAWTNTTTYGGSTYVNVASGGYAPGSRTIHGLKIVTDSTNTTYYHSLTPGAWRQVFQHTKNTFCTPDTVGFGMSCYNQTLTMQVDSFQLTQP